MAGIIARNGNRVWGLWYTGRKYRAKAGGSGSRFSGAAAMKLQKVTIENYRAIERLELRLHPQLTALHGDNGHGKTSVLGAIAVGLGSILRLLPDVGSIDFLKTDRRGLQPHLVELVTTDGLVWQRRKSFGGSTPAGSVRHIATVTLPHSGNPTYGLRKLREVIGDIVAADLEGKPRIDLPIVAFYDTDRAVLDVPQRRRRRSGRRDFSRYAALEGALSVRSNFRDFFNWFDAKEGEELRGKRDARNFDYQLKELNAVRGAIAAMVPGISRPRTTRNPTRFVVSAELPDGEAELEIGQLSGGYRIMLALAADLARRMAQGNPHRDDPLQSEAIVLIDEVDLHLHPSWQQRVLPDLMRTFPKAQFIVSTHSPQVLTTVKPEHIVSLYREGDNIVAGGAGAATYGAKAGYVLATAMGVNERPSAEHNEFVNKLERYNQLVYAGRGESEDALTLRKELERLSPRDLALDSADSEMRRQKVMQRWAEERRKETSQ